MFAPKVAEASTKTAKSSIAKAAPRSSSLVVRSFGGNAVEQAKREVGAVEEPLEYEADRVADQVMRMPAPGSGAQPQVSLKCAACEEEDGLQKKGADAAPPALSEARPSVHETLRSAGQPLDAATRTYFEPRFRQ